MAKKKTKKVVTKEPASIVYSGQVSVSIRSGAKTLSKKVYHNTGGTALFTFLANCIKNGAGDTSSLLPNKVKLFYVDTAKKTKPSEIVTELAKTANYGEKIELEDQNIDISQASIFVAKSDTGNVNNKSITLSFRIPYAYITKTNVNMICLYGRGINATGYWSAYYLFTKQGEDTWENLQINSSQNYNLLIEWKMTFDNNTNKEN